MKSIFFYLFLAAFLSPSCASRRGVLVTGTGIGVANGAIVGAALKRQGKKDASAVGAVVGGLTGFLFGQFINNRLEERDKRVRRDVLFNLQNFGITESEKKDFNHE